MVLVAPNRKASPKKPKASAPPPPPPVVEAAAPAPPPPVVVSADLRVVHDDDLQNAGAFYVQGEGTGSTDLASGQELRRWPTLEEAARRFGVGLEVVRQRASIDGWDGRRSMFQADLERARSRGIAERIAQQEMPARLAYIGVHNDSMRALGRMLQKFAPQNGEPTCLPRDLKLILETACKAAELLSHATGKARESQGAFSLAVQVAQAQALGVPVSVLPPGMQAAVQPVQETSSGPVVQSLWSILVEARKTAPAQAAAVGSRDEWDEPSPLPAHLASDRMPS